MQNPKLTKAHREEILKRTLSHAFGARALALAKAFAALAEDVYNDVFSEKDRKLMQSLPESWLPTDNDISVEFGVGFRSLYFNGRNAHISGLSDDVYAEIENKYKRFPYQRRQGCLKAYAADHDLSVKAEELSNQVKALKVEVEAASNITRVALDRATTLRNLISGWPEIEPFTTFIPRDRPSLPAIQTDALNSILGLPVEDKKEAA